MERSWYTMCQIDDLRVFLQYSMLRQMLAELPPEVGQAQPVLALKQKLESRLG